ncbi:hypothetical protein Tco_0223616 [Tanacetum coccineum]
MPACMLTPLTDESDITYTQLSSVQGVDTQSYVIDNVMRQLSFEETELDGEAGFADVVRSGVDSSGLNVGRTQEPIMAEVPTVEEVGTQEFTMEDVVLEDYVSSGEDVEMCNGQFDESAPMPDDALEGEDVDFINADNFNSDPGKDDEIINYRRRRVNLNIPVTIVQDQLQREIEVQISMSKAFRAKPEREIRGDHVLQYSMLRHYVVELQSTNPNTTVKIAVERNIDPSLPTRVPSIGAVGLDSNNGIYPLAYALVEAEIFTAFIFMSISNICEVFNGKIVGGRDKPVITLLEYIREYCMKRIMNVQSVIDICAGPLTPTATRIMESIKKKAHLMKVKWNGANKYQVLGSLSDQCVVDVHHPRSVGKSLLLVDYMEGKILLQGGNNAEASGSTSKGAQQTEPAVGQDGSGGSGGGVVIGLSASQGGAGGPGGAGVAIQVSETRNADGREMDDGIPTQSSAAGGAISDNGNFPMVDEEEVTSKKLAPMVEEMIMVEKLADGWRTTISYFVKKAMKKYADDE